METVIILNLSGMVRETTKVIQVYNRAFSWKDINSLETVITIMHPKINKSRRTYSTLDKTCSKNNFFMIL